MSGGRLVTHPWGMQPPDWPAHLLGSPAPLTQRDTGSQEVGREAWIIVSPGHCHVAGDAERAKTTGHA